MKTESFPEVGWMKEKFNILKLDDEILELEWTMQPGGGVPAHLHKDSNEYFDILEGEINFIVDGKPIIAKPGDHITVPKNIMHSISNKSSAIVKSRVSYHPVVDQGKFFEVLLFLKELDPNDKNILFKGMYIADQMHYREFSTVKGGLKIAETIMMGLFRLISPISGWNKLLEKYRARVSVEN